jgi:hypothetical protein
VNCRQWKKFLQAYVNLSETDPTVFFEKVLSSNLDHMNKGASSHDKGLEQGGCTREPGPEKQGRAISLREPGPARPLPGAAESRTRPGPGCPGLMRKTAGQKPGEPGGFCPRTEVVILCCWHLPPWRLAFGALVTRLGILRFHLRAFVVPNVLTVTSFFLNLTE